MSSAAAPPPPTPTIIAGRYELQRRLAQGGMAEVWLAIDRTLDRKVAVKWLKPALATDEVVAERFRREAVAAASLNHPNIVAIHDVFEQDGRQAVVMQLVDGKSLRQLLDTQKRLSPELTCHIGMCVAAALDHAHEAGFVHRDVKPGNIMLTADGRVLLTDFGIAKGLSGTETDLTSDNVMMGTAKYLSPEQVRGKKLDGRADLYSLGLVLYECLAGRVPFLGETDADTALARLQRDPTDLARLRATLPTRLVAIVHQLLARNPDRRPATGAVLVTELKLAAQEGPPEIDPTDEERSPVAPFAAGRLRRAASDHHGRASDRVRSSRSPSLPGSRTSADDIIRPHRGGSTTAPDGTRKAVDGAARSTSIPGEPPRFGVTGSVPTTPPPVLRPPTPPEPPSPPRQRDHTPAAGHSLRGQPARGMAQSTTPSRTVIGALLVVAAIVAAMLWLGLRFGGDDEPAAPTSVLPGEAAAEPDGDADGGGDPAADGDDGGAAAGAPNGAASIVGVIAYDPDGDAVENDELAGAAVDGDPSTSWRTLCYSSQYLGGKRGVGLVVSFDGPTTQRLRVAVDSAPYQVRFYGTDAADPPATFDGWGTPFGDTAFATEPGDVVSEPPPTAVRHVLVAFNELGPDDGCTDSNPYRGRITEISPAG